MAKTVYLRPLAIISSTNWANGGSSPGATILESVDPLRPVNHDDAVSYGQYQEPSTGDKLTVSLTDKPNDILSVTSLKVLVRDRAIDQTGTVVPSLELLGSSQDGSGWTNTVGSWVDRTALVTRPGGGDWVPADVAEPTLYASVRVTSFGTPSPSAYEQVTSLYVELIYEPLPAGADSIRDAASRTQWGRAFDPPLLQRELLNPADAYLVDLLGVVGISHREGPHAQGQGWRSLAWQRRPHSLQRRVLDLNTGKVVASWRDLRRQLSLLRYTARATSAIAGADGMAFFAAGSAIEFTRDTLAWVEDQSGQVRRVDEGQLKYAAAEPPASGSREYGLLIEPAAQQLVQDSGFKRGAADTFTGWEEDEAGTGSITDETSTLWWDPNVVPRAAKLTMDNGGTGGALLKQTHPDTITANTVVAISIVHHDTGDTLEYVLRREVDNNYYDFSTGMWGASISYLEIPLSDGEWTRDFLGFVDVGGSNTQLRSFIGRTNARVSVASQVNLVAHLQIEDTTAPYMTSPILTDANTDTRDADDFKITNDSGARCVSAGQGVFSFRYVPNWDAADVSADVTILKVTHDANNYLEFRWSNSNQKWEFLYVAGGTTYTAAGDASDGEPTRGVAVTLVARWTGSAAELDLTAHTMELFVDGTKGGTSDVKTTLTEAAASDIALQAAAHGVFQDFQSLAYPATDEECARLPRL